MPFYRRLMVDPTFREFPWKRTHLWLVDERRVPLTDDRSNWAHIASILLDHSDIPRAHAHAIDATAVDAEGTLWLLDAGSRRVGRASAR